MIVQPEIEKIQSDCEQSLKFQFQSTDSAYKHPNGSILYLVGVNEDRGKSARGAFANIVVADEFGFWDYPDIIENILQPQLLNQRLGQMIIASTPPENLGHPYYSKKGKAISDGRFLQRTIYDNEALTPEQIEEAMRDSGGEDSPTWKREYLCKPVASPERLVIPEYQEENVLVPNDLPAPNYRDCYVGIDLGFNDQTAFLFGYLDFLNNTLVIEDELILTGKNSQEITDEAKDIEEKLWGEKAPYLRVSDNDLQQLYDMQTLCDYQVMPTRKDDRLAAINALRLRFTEGKIKIKERCKSLHYQLKVGLWNERRTDFQRGEFTGHLDAVAALIYLHRNLNLTRNPFPQYEGARPDTHWINPGVQIGSPGEHEALREAFKLGGRSRT